jgi:hypothetical protein
VRTSLKAVIALPLQRAPFDSRGREAAIGTGFAAKGRRSRLSATSQLPAHLVTTVGSIGGKPISMDVACPPRKFATEPKTIQTRFLVKKRFDLSEDSSTALILPFAQYDMFFLFMEGIIPSYLAYITRILKKVLDERSASLIKSYVREEERVVEKKLSEVENESICETFGQEFQKFREDNLVSPVIDVSCGVNIPRR